MGCIFEASSFWGVLGINSTAVPTRAEVHDCACTILYGVCGFAREECAMTCKYLATVHRKQAVLRVLDGLTSMQHRVELLAKENLACTL